MSPWPPACAPEGYPNVQPEHLWARRSPGGEWFPCDLDPDLLFPNRDPEDEQAPARYVREEAAAERLAEVEAERDELRAAVLKLRRACTVTRADLRAGGAHTRVMPQAMVLRLERALDATTAALAPEEGSTHER